MSKKTVSRALRALDAGAESAEIDEILRDGSVTETFLRRRLGHLIDSGDSDSASARRLWAAKFGDSPPVGSTRDAKAPEPATRPPLQGAVEGAAPESTDGEPPPTVIRLDDPAPLLSWVTRHHSGVFSLAALKRFEVWGVVATATLARSESSGPLALTDYEQSAAGRFAHAIGSKDLIRGVVPASRGEPGRTAKLRRLTAFGEIEDAASEISHLLVQDEQERATRLTVKYVVVELLRNVIQHSHDELGGVVAAQRMDDEDRRSLQVAVADAGVGIFEAMIEKHPNLGNHGEALEKALWPHFSGTFEEGLSGSQQNAGLGLFFISEMAKLTGGRLLLATHGASLLLTADPEAGDNHEMRFLKPDGLGYPGTLIAFELPIDSVGDYDDLIQTIQQRARERTPMRARHHWIRYDRSPGQAKSFVVRYTSENTEQAEKFAREQLEPLILRREVVVLDFQGMEIATQSYLHALLYDALRLAWAKQSFIYVVNASPSVRSGIELVEAYALGGVVAQPARW